ncbi:hypothetical protein F7725_000812 [Dissostichus mawsoni]|uniref:dCMP deaminase n=1 Tax=Dissostichus mawsoni TaxID=36200 RepID=A0A7J5ZIQ0_DISMA|nr:hypothetical protein F7725_000812 [Dissostichus mawsoni]
MINGARKDFMEPEDYFMAAAVLSARQSRDPSTQVGACIVNQDKKVVGVVCHAVLNAIMNKNSADVKGCSIYVTLFPSNECAKLIIQAGMKEVVYLCDKYHGSLETQAAKRMFKQAKIPFREFLPKETDVVLKLKSVKMLLLLFGLMAVTSPLLLLLRLLLLLLKLSWTPNTFMQRG